MKKQDEKQLHSSAEVSPVSRSRQREHKKDLPTAVISGLKWHELFPNCTPLGCLGRMLPALSIWGSTKRFLTWNAKDTLFKHTYIQLVASARGMSASELLSSRLMFPTPLASDTNTNRDARNLDVFLSENGIFRKRNKSGSIWSLSLSAAVFYLTPAASEGYRSTLKPTAFRNISPGANLSTQIVQMEKPKADNMALNPDWVEWLMGFPLGWTDVSFGPESRKECHA